MMYFNKNKLVTLSLFAYLILSISAMSMELPTLGLPQDSDPVFSTRQSGHASPRSDDYARMLKLDLGEPPRTSRDATLAEYQVTVDAAVHVTGESRQEPKDLESTDLPLLGMSLLGMKNDNQSSAPLLTFVRRGHRRNPSHVYLHPINDQTDVNSTSSNQE